MAQPKLSRRLTAEDASFLYFEKKEFPLHIGSVSVFEGDLHLDRFLELIEAKLHLIPRYRQRVHVPPLNVGHPTWEDDADFDLRKHVTETTLAEPGGEAELQELAGQFFTGLMDREKPLWEMMVVHGLEGGRSAFLSKVHHSMVDGISGVALTSVLMDPMPDAPLPPKQPYQPTPPPDTARLITEAIGQGWMETFQRLLDAQRTFFDLSQSLLSPSGLQGFSNLVRYMPELAFPVQRLPFNKRCEGQRKMAWSEFSFNEARAIRGAVCGTVNDVCLSVLTGAVARYLEAHGEPIAGKHVRFMVPVNLRREEHRGSMGNRVSVLPVSIPLDIIDPKQRLETVNHRMMAMKDAHLAEIISLMAAWLGTAPAMLQAVVGSLPYALPSPPFNMVATNVPGPMIPLYCCGHRMLTYYPHVPVGAEMGLNCAIHSYDQRLFFGLTADGAAAPDVMLLKQYLDEAFVELRTAAGVPVMEPVETWVPAQSSRRVAVPAERTKAVAHTGHEERAEPPSKAAVAEEAVQSVKEQITPPAAKPGRKGKRVKSEHVTAAE